MEIVNFGKQGFANRFCRELADSIANLRVWAPGSEAEGLPHYRAHTRVDPFGVGGFPDLPFTFKIKQPLLSISMGFKSQLNHYQRMQLSQVKYLNDMAEAFQNRTKSTHLRREILQKQDQRNYRSEYDRIRSHVENSATPALTKDHIKDRQAHLKKLGARAVDTIT